MLSHSEKSSGEVVDRKVDYFCVISDSKMTLRRRKLCKRPKALVSRSAGRPFNWLSSQVDKVLFCQSGLQKIYLSKKQNISICMKY